MALVVKETKHTKKVVSCGGCGADTNNESGFCDNCDAPDIVDDIHAMDDGRGWAKIGDDEEEDNEDQEMEE